MAITDSPHVNRIRVAEGKRLQGALRRVYLKYREVGGWVLPNQLRFLPAAVANLTEIPSAPSTTC